MCRMGVTLEDKTVILTLHNKNTFSNQIDGVLFSTDTKYKSIILKRIVTDGFGF